MSHLSNINIDVASRLAVKYPSMLPIIIWKLDDGIILPKLKYLVKYSLTCAQFMYVVRKHIKNLTENEAIVLLVMTENGNEIFVPMSQSIGILYQQHNIDGFLRVCILKENVFG
jgi:hypothetical protein